MSEIELRRENESLRERNAQLRQRTADAESALAALARGEVDAVTLGGTTPVLLHAAQESLRQSQQLLRAIFDGALDAILLADDDGRYVDANPAACRLFDLPREKLIGRSIGEFASTGSDSESVYQAFGRGGQMRGHFPLRRTDGTERVLEYSAARNVAPGLHLSVLRDITDRIAAERALRHNEALFRAVIEKTTEAISLTSADGTTRYLTPSAWRLLGWTRDEMGTRTLRDEVIPEDRLRIANELERLMRTGNRDMSLEFRVRHRDGSIRWIESSGTNLLDDPNVRAIVGNYRDITERKLAAEALRESRDLLEEAQAIAHIGSWILRVAPRMELSWSFECYRIFGIPAGTPMTMEAFFARVHPGDRQRVQAASDAALAVGGSYDMEHRVEWSDGQVRWVHQRATIERDDASGPTRVLGTVEDVTDRRLAVDALRSSEERYRRIVEGTSEGVWVYDTENVTTFVNERMAQMLGYTVEEAIGLPIYEFMDETWRAAAQARTERGHRGLSEGGDFQLKHKNGTKSWASINSSPLFDAGGRFEAGLALVTDVSARRHEDEARARLAAIVESSEDAIIGANLSGMITSWNRGAEKLFQYSAEDMVGHSIFALLPPTSPREESSDLTRAARGESVGQYETKRRRKDGTLVDVAVTISPVRDAGGTVIGVSKIARDLTARRQTEAVLRRTEEQFRQAQKMEAVGRLAGGVAHDFNNLLSVILTFATLSLEDLKPGDPLHSNMGEIRAAGQRATELTKQLLAFSRQQVLKPQVVDLNHIVRGIEAMLGRLLGADIELTTLTSPDVGRVLADPGQMEQILMNLAVNARDAMPEGGKLTIETANIELDGEYVGAHFGVTPGDYVVLAVSDTGIGMDAVTRGRIFEPFFTTKEKGKGTGLGLSTVFGIVEQSGGHVVVYSEPGRGCTFKIYLRRTDRVFDSTLPVSPPTVLRGSETILLVDDEERVRAAARAILLRNGYHVLEASNGGEAFLISKDFPAKIHLLLTDVVMPRMSGRKLAEELAPGRPDMKILFTSGYTDDVVVHHGVLDAGVAFLQKPFTPDSLLRKIREVFDTSAPGE